MKRNNQLINVLLTAVLSISTSAAAVAASSYPTADGAEKRHGVLVSYAEDSFKEIAARRYDRSPFYVPIALKADTASFKVPAEWGDARVVLGLETPPETNGRITVEINGNRLSTVHPGDCQWDITDYLVKGGRQSLRIEGAGGMPRRMYAYATSKRVFIGSYTVATQLKPVADAKPVGVINLDIVVGGIKQQRKDISLEYQLFDAYRHQVAAGRADAAPRLSFKASVPNITAWTTNDPYRYMLVIILRDDRTGAHIQTVGTPLRFADIRTIEHGAAPFGYADLSGRMFNVKMARLDSLPSEHPDREFLASQLHMGGANAVTSPWTDQDWADLCEAYGLSAYTNGALSPAQLSDAILIDGSPEQWGRLVRGFAPVEVHLTDTTNLTLDVANRTDFKTLDEYRLDWELIDIRGVGLRSGKEIILSTGPGQSDRVTLLEGQATLPEKHEEALLNLNWKRLSDGAFIADQQMIIAPKGMEEARPIKPQKLNRNKNTYQAKHTVIEVNPNNGKTELIDLMGWEVDIADIAPAGNPINRTITYDKKERSLDMTGSAGSDISYRIDMDGALIVNTADGTITMKIPSDVAEGILYMGRGPADSPKEEQINRSRISFNRSTPTIEYTADGMPRRHSDTRYLLTTNSDRKPTLRIDSESPFEFSASSPQPGEDVTLTITGLRGPLRITGMR